MYSAFAGHDPDSPIHDRCMHAGHRDRVHESVDAGGWMFGLVSDVQLHAAAAHVLVPYAQPFAVSERSQLKLYVPSAPLSKTTLIISGAGLPAGSGVSLSRVKSA